MLQYILTGLAGIALGIVGLRLWQARNAIVPAKASSPTLAAGGERQQPARSAGATGKLLLGAAVLAIAAIAVIVLRGSGDEPASVAAGTTAETPASGQSLEDVDTMILRLSKRLETDTQDGEGFRMLGWSYVMTGRPELAIAPYERALALLPQSAAVHAGYGEALVGVAKNSVTPKARAEFLKAVAIDPAEPRARYFLSLWKAQNGKEREALDEWLDLANGTSADAPWQADLRRQIGETAGKLGVDVSSRLKAPAPADATIGPPQIDAMVEGLAAKLKANPDNPDGWIQLLRSRMVLKQNEQAGKDLNAARRALASDAAGLTKVNAAATEFGVPDA